MLPDYFKCFLILYFVVAMADLKQKVDGTISGPYKQRARYDNYRIYMVEFLNEEQVKVFKALEEQSDSLAFIGHAREVGQKLSILVAAHKLPDFLDLINHYNVKHQLLVIDNLRSENFQEKIDESYAAVQPVDSDVKNFDWQHYYHLETIYLWMEMMAKQYESLVSLFDIGTSTLGVPIKGIKISHSNSNKTIFIESGIHAREWIAPAAATYIINTLLTSTEENTKMLVKNYNWIILPCINPDGYKYTFESDRMWRKNRQLFYTCRGVDLNRNYPDHWNSTGSSSNPCHYDYAGPSPGSELETQRLMQYLADNVDKEQITIYIALHSYSQMIMFPYGYTKEHVSNYNDLKELAEQAAQAIEKLSGKQYKTGSIIETIYPSSGGSMDWVYATQNIPIAYTFELRGPPDSPDMFLLPAKEILPTAQEAFAAIESIVNGAARKGYFHKT